MIDNTFVIDGVGHAMDFSDGNLADGVPEEVIVGFRRFGHGMFQGQIESREPGYQLTFEEWYTEFTAEDLAHAFFVESDVDVVAGHSVWLAPLFKNGMFRWDTLLELRDLAPERVYLYYGVDTFDPDRASILDGMEQAVEQGAIGFKFYPSNGVFDREANRMVSQFYDDPETAYPLFEKAIDLGVKTVAFHKAQPVGIGPDTLVNVQDISTAAARFPELNFEVVHAGWAFVEDTANQLQFHQNVYATLENAVGFLVNQPTRFAHILGLFLRVGAEDLLIYGSGCPLNHPDPQLRAFWDFEMPQELVDGYGYPPVTREIKEKILARNWARMHSVDLDEKRAAIANDSWSEQRKDEKAAPWSHLRSRLQEA